MHDTRPAATFVSIGIAIAAAILAMVIALPLLSDSPAQTLGAFLMGPFRNLFYLGNFLNRVGLYLIAGMAMVIAFRGGMFNLGGEGQVYAGALATTMFLLSVPKLSGLFGILAAVMVAILTGTLIAGLSGFLKMKWNTDELISSFLLSSSIVYTIDYLVSGPLRNTDSFLLSTREIAPQFRLPQLMPPSHLNLSLMAGLLLVVLTHKYLFHTSSGYELRMIGLNREFARYGGIPVRRYYFIPMALSGALYGLAGGLYVLGTSFATLQGSTSGMGWNGIAIALIGRIHPVLLIPASVIFTYLEFGGENAMIYADFSFEFGAVLQAIVLFLVTARISKRRKRNAALDS
ncbi:MAG: ABC transporter permease [Spirochaetota bacterium]